MPPRKSKKTPLEHAIALFKEIKKLKLPPGFSAILIQVDDEEHGAFVAAHHVFHEPSVTISGKTYMAQQHLEAHIMAAAIMANRVRSIAGELAKNTPMHQNEIVDAIMGVAQQLLEGTEEIQLAGEDSDG